MKALSPELQALIQGRVARWVHLVRLHFQSDTLYASDAARGVSFLWEDVAGSGIENEFRGFGELAGVSEIEEGIETKPYNLTLGLTGIDDPWISVALTEKVQNRRVFIWRAWLNEDHRIVDQPVLRFAGRMNNFTLERNPGGYSTALLAVTNRLADWDRKAAVRFNDKSHQARHPGDKFFEFAEASAERELIWGKQ